MTDITYCQLAVKTDLKERQIKKIKLGFSGTEEIILFHTMSTGTDKKGSIFNQPTGRAKQSFHCQKKRKKKVAPVPQKRQIKVIFSFF